MPATHTTPAAVQTTPTLRRSVLVAVLLTIAAAVAIVAAGLAGAVCVVVALSTASVMVAEHGRGLVAADGREVVR